MNNYFDLVKNRMNPNCNWFKNISSHWANFEHSHFFLTFSYPWYQFELQNVFVSSPFIQAFITQFSISI